MRDVRLTVNVERGLAETLKRAAKATDQSVSGLVAELLETVGPVLARMAELRELADKAQAEVAQGWKANLEQAQEKLEPVVLRAMQLMGIVPEQVEGLMREAFERGMSLGEGESPAERTTREPAARKLREVR